MLVLSNCLKFCVLIIFCIINIGIVTANDITPDDHLHQLHATNANKGYEDALISIIESIQKQNLEIALDKVELHLATFPKSREGHLLKADILQAMSGALNGLGQHDLIPPEDLKKFKHQLRNRLKHIGEEADKAHSLFPASLIALGEHKHLMVADMTNGRLYLYENIDGKPKLIRDYYLSIGSEGYGKEIEGDNRTPVGVYEINGTELTLLQEATGDLPLNNIQGIVSVGEIGGSVSTEDVVLDNSEIRLSVFPNPNKGDQMSVDFFLREASDYDVTLYNIQGNTISSGEIAGRGVVGNNTISLGNMNLEAGTYLIRLNLESGSITNRFIVIR